MTNLGLFLIFIICNAINVVIQTVKSIATVKCNKYIAALINALAYGFYTYIIVLTVCDLNLWTKIIVVGTCNLVGVFIVKLIEEKMQKNKLWKIELTINRKKEEDFALMLEGADISYYNITNGKWSHFYCFCSSREESAAVREIAKKFNVKHFASENKIL